MPAVINYKKRAARGINVDATTVSVLAHVSVKSLAIHFVRVLLPLRSSHLRAAAF